MRNPPTRWARFAAALGLVALAACSPEIATEEQTEQTLRISTIGRAFRPERITAIRADKTRLLLRNRDSITHSFRLFLPDTTEPAYEVPPLGAGRTVDVMLPVSLCAPCTMTYRCGIHPEMQGTITTTRPRPTPDSA